MTRSARRSVVGWTSVAPLPAFNSQRATNNGRSRPNRGSTSPTVRNFRLKLTAGTVARATPRSACCRTVWRRGCRARSPNSRTPSPPSNVPPVWPPRRRYAPGDRSRQAPCAGCGAGSGSDTRLDRGARPAPGALRRLRRQRPRLPRPHICGVATRDTKFSGLSLLVQSHGFGVARIVRVEGKRNAHRIRHHGDDP